MPDSMAGNINNEPLQPVLEKSYPAQGQRDMGKNTYFLYKRGVFFEPLRGRPSWMLLADLGGH